MEVTMALHRQLQQYPDRPLTVFGDRVRTVRESADRVARLAAALQGLGVAAGDRVGILALNSDRYHEYLLAVPWSGAVVNPVNIRCSASEIIFALRESDTRVLLVDDTFVPLVPDLQAGFDGLTTIIYCGDSDAPQGTLDYEQLLRVADPVPDARRHDHDLYGLFYTGGTTGLPKGVMLDHTAIVTSALGETATSDIFTRRGNLLHVAPMFHLAGIAAWKLGMVLGSTHVILPTFHPVAVADAIERHAITDVLLVPTMIQMLVDAPGADSRDWSSLQKILYGASPISETVLDRARKAFPAAGFSQGYGMTELAPIATLLAPEDHDNPRLRRAAGRPVAHVELKVVDEFDNEVPRGTVGEIIVRGDNVMQGYWNRPEETAAALRGGYMHTGDGGYMDQDGYVFIVDRIKDMIITGGENVYSAEVENALAKHEAVASCAVIGVPDDRWGERVHAVVVLREGQQVTAEELTESCRRHVANYKLPRGISFVQALPMSAAGKILKRELRKQHWADADRGVS